MLNGYKEGLQRRRVQYGLRRNRETPKEAERRCRNQEYL